MWVPSTAVGPRMYFTVPSWSQATSIWSGGSTMPRPVRFAGLVQSSFSNASVTFEVTFVPPGCSGVPDGLGVGLPLGLADGPGVLLSSCRRGGSLIPRPLLVAPSLGLALGLPEPLGSADGDPLGLPLGFGCATGAAFLACRTGRNRSSAVVPMPSVSSTGPGIDTTMLLLPCLTTSASATPLPLTRARMMSSAWFNADEVTAPPSCDFAVNVTL